MEAASLGAEKKDGPESARPSKNDGVGEAEKPGGSIADGRLDRAS
jgi:hypothetical protein